MRWKKVVGRARDGVQEIGHVAAKIGDILKAIDFNNDYINTVTGFEKEHFNHNGVTVKIRNPHCWKIIGFPLSNEEICNFSGAPTGSTITVIDKPYWSHSDVGSEPVRPGLYFYVENDTYIRAYNIIGIFRDAQSQQLGIYLKLINFKPGRVLGLAARMLAIIVRQALSHSQNFVYMELLAAGGRKMPPLDAQSGERWGGYVAWPKYGFDMQLRNGTVQMANHFPYYPNNIISCQYVSDVLRQSGGREYWKMLGDGDQMTFDLSSTDTASIKKLNAYLKKERK